MLEGISVGDLLEREHLYSSPWLFNEFNFFFSFCICFWISPFPILILTFKVDNNDGILFLTPLVNSQFICFFYMSEKPNLLNEWQIQNCQTYWPQLIVFF